MTLGLVAAPETTEKITAKLAEELPELLGQRIDPHVTWKISVFKSALAGANPQSPAILDDCHACMLKYGWDLALYLTDVPIYRDSTLVVADASFARGVAGITFPIMGMIGLHRKVREAALRLLDELYHARCAKRSAGRQSGRKAAIAAPADVSQRQKYRHPYGGWFADLVSPIWRESAPGDDMKAMDVDVRFVSSKARGYFRLMLGMAAANRPWQLISCFKGAIATAFGTAAYALLISSIWQLEDAFGLARRWAFMFFSMAAMMIWIIVSHNLWEPLFGRRARALAAFYNGATVLTFTLMVLFAYTVLFALLFVATWLFIPSAYFQAKLKHPVGPEDYVLLTWTTTSLAMMAGAIGAGLGDPDAIRQATYSYRQERRAEEQRKEDAD
jgi:hypothetical protein